MTDDAIVVEGLEKSYGSVRALHGVDFAARTGSVLGLLGPNGAGKTTAVRILATLLEADAGTARVAGLDVKRDAAALRAQIGLAGQYAAVDENLTGFENLEMVGRLYHLGKAESKQRADELLERFELTDAAKRPAKTYSGGMRRRLDLAAALVARPPVLFLDEPTTGLDPRSRIGMWETIEARVAAGSTVLLTTQYLDEADRLADQIVVIDHGKVIAEGTCDELKAQIGGDRLDITLEDLGDVDAAIAALAEMCLDRATAEGLVVHAPVRPRHGVIPEAIRKLDAAGVGVDDIALHRPTLDDVFIALTGHRGRGHDGGARRGEGGRGRMSVSTTIEDTMVLAKRNLMRIPRQPDLLIAYTVQPVMFVLLFVYVFGGAIQTPGFDYVDFLMPGIIVQSIAFGGFVTALGLSEDVKKGLIDRFRSLPMSRAAVLNARTSSDILLNCLSLVVLFAVGFAAGFNFIDATVGEIVLGIVLCLYLGYAFSWIFALIGLYSSSPETANSIGFTLIFPLTFASSVFVPAESMPDGLRQFAEANPFTTISDAVRSLWLNTPANSDIWMSFIWCTALTAIFAPLAVNRYRKVTAT